MLHLSTSPKLRHALWKLQQFTCCIGMLACGFLKTGAQELTTVEYSDSYTQRAGSTMKRVPMLSKEERTGTQSSIINIKYANEIDYEYKKAIEYAASVWGSYIVNSVPLYIEVQLTELEEDIRTTVQYRTKDGLKIPIALFAYQQGNKDRDHDNPDGIIAINTHTNWDFGLGENSTENAPNLAYGVMRAIARILGFGSDVVIDNSGNYKFSDKREHTIFNTLVENGSGKKLKDISVYGGRPNSELKSFAEESAQTFWVNTSNGKFQLSSPPYNALRPPFVYLKDENSLMRPTLYNGDHILAIDTSTQTIINELGWNVKTPVKINIQSSDVPNTGLASAYTQHYFSIDKGNLNIANPVWTLSMQLSDGSTETTFLTDKNLTCTTLPIVNENRYKIEQDGLIKASLNFSCTIDGKEEKAMPYSLYLELKPFIEYAKIEKIVDNYPYDSYDAHFSVKYRGAESITYFVEEEYSTVLIAKIINEPYLAYGVADHITSSDYAWIDFTAENSYGSATYTIELMPYGETLKDNHAQRLDSRKYNNCGLTYQDNNYDAYDIQGNFLGRYRSIDEIKASPLKGLLIFKVHNRDGLIRTFKITKSQ